MNEVIKNCNLLIKDAEKQEILLTDELKSKYIQRSGIKIDNIYWARTR